MSIVLGKRPFTAIGESLNGYLLRLAKCNGLVGIYELLDAIGMTKAKSRRFGIWSDNELHDLNTVLTVSLERFFDATKMPCQKYYPWVYKEHRMLQDLRVDFPRVCPNCLAEGNPIDWRWGLGHIAQCEKHVTHLLDTCPHCTAPLQWEKSILQGCHQCGVKWKDVALYDACELSDFEQAVYPTIQGLLDIEMDQLTSLCLAMFKIARPYDLMRQTLQRIPYSRNHNELVKQAYGLLENKNRYEVSDIHRDSVYRPDKQMVIEFNERPEYVRKARLKLVDSPYAPALREHVNHELLSTALGISKSDILKVISISEFPQENSTSVIRDKIFNLHTVNTYLKNFHFATDTGFLVVVCTDKRFIKHLTSYGDLVVDVLTAKVKAVLSSVSLASISIDPVEFESWLKAKLLKACQSPVGITKVAKLIGKNNDDVRMLIKKSELHYAAWDRYLYTVDGQSLMSYLNHCHSH
jgi:hypothetical protein